MATLVYLNLEKLVGSPVLEQASIPHLTDFSMFNQGKGKPKPNE